MVSEIRIFVEGDKALPNGFRAFLKPITDIARQRRIRFRVAPGGSKDETIKDFIDALQDEPEIFNILLLDSDEPDKGTLIASVKARSTWDNQTGVNVQDGQIHFMVQVMESWFLADIPALERYYGNGFQQNRLPRNPSIEQISKNDVIRGLEGATRGTSKGKYSKTRHAPELLQRVDSSKLRNRSVSPNCDRLFATLESLVSNT